MKRSFRFIHNSNILTFLPKQATLVIEKSINSTKVCNCCHFQISACPAAGAAVITLQGTDRHDRRRSRDLPLEPLIIQFSPHESMYAQIYPTRAAHISPGLPLHFVFLEGAAPAVSFSSSTSWTLYSSCSLSCCSLTASSEAVNPKQGHGCQRYTSPRYHFRVRLEATNLYSLFVASS